VPPPPGKAYVGILACGGSAPCAPGAGPCCQPGGNGGVGCNDPFCCNAVCALDPYCCETEWDGICANLAQVDLINCACDSGDPVASCFGQRIGRVELFSPVGGAEGISFIRAYEHPLVSCPWDCQEAPNDAVGINDLLRLIGDWADPSPCDFDGGGVGVLDLLALLGNWGPCETTCKQPGTCDTRFVVCGRNLDPCYCFMLPDGSGFCAHDFLCAGLTECPGGNCPPGFVCIVSSCCGVDVCVPASQECSEGLAVAPGVQPEVSTSSAIVPGAARSGTGGAGSGHQ
jgi:hypothetical protein